MARTLNKNRATIKKLENVTSLINEKVESETLKKYQMLLLLYEKKQMN